MTHPHPSPARLVVGFVIWGSSLVVLYAAHAIGCDLGWERRSLGPLPLLHSILVLLWIAHLAAFAPLLLRMWRPRPPDHWARAHLAATLAALAATIWTGIPVAVLETCR